VAVGLGPKVRLSPSEKTSPPATGPRVLKHINVGGAPSRAVASTLAHRFRPGALVQGTVGRCCSWASPVGPSDGSQDRSAYSASQGGAEQIAPQCAPAATWSLTAVAQTRLSGMVADGAEPARLGRRGPANSRRFQKAGSLRGMGGDPESAVVRAAGPAGTDRPSDIAAMAVFLASRRGPITLDRTER